MINAIKGWVIIASSDQKGNQITRDEYIAYCHNKNKVMIITEDNGTYWIKGVFSLIQNRMDSMVIHLH